MHYALPLLSLVFLAAADPSGAAVKSLSVTVTGITHGHAIPDKFASCMADGKGSAKPAGNISPAIAWSGAPRATKSFAIIVVDKDVPKDFSHANKPGQVIADVAARKDFFHWVVVDIPASTRSLAQNAKPAGFIARNDLGPDRTGISGYGGPCPPWNDARLHHYHFKVFALDETTLGLSGDFGAKQVLDAMKGHILAQGEVVATYTTRAKASS